jgi:hypothetical protein
VGALRCATRSGLEITLIVTLCFKALREDGRELVPLKAEAGRWWGNGPSTRAAARDGPQPSWFTTDRGRNECRCERPEVPRYWFAISASLGCRP